MSERKLGHEHLKNLYKGREQSAVSIATNTQPKQSNSSRRRDSAKSKISGAASLGRGKGGGTPAKSGKSIKRHSGQRSKSKHTSSEKKSKVETPSRKKTIKEPPPTSAADKSNRNRASSKSPHTVRTPTTPNTPPQESRGRSRKSSTKKDAKKGPEVQEKTEPCNTVFENDAGVTAPTTTTKGASKGDTRQSLDGPGGEGHIKLAAARIKERKLQWKKDGAPSPDKTPVKTDPRQAETSAPPSEGSGHYDPQQYETKKDGEKKDVKHEANNTIRERTVFDNDFNTPAVVKEEKPHLQWAPGAGPPPEDGGMSAPRKKKSAADAHQSPKKGGSSPNLVSPTRQKTNPRSTTGSTDKDHGVDPAEQMVSCYITPTMQHAAFNSAEMIKKMEEEKQKH